MVQRARKKNGSMYFLGLRGRKEYRSHLSVGLALSRCLVINY